MLFTYNDEYCPKHVWRWCVVHIRESHDTCKSLTRRGQTKVTREISRNSIATTYHNSLRARKEQSNVSPPQLLLNRMWFMLLCRLQSIIVADKTTNYYYCVNLTEKVNPFGALRWAPGQCSSIIIFFWKEYAEYILWYPQHTALL